MSWGDKTIGFGLFGSVLTNFRFYVECSFSRKRAEVLRRTLLMLIQIAFCLVSQFLQRVHPVKNSFDPEKIFQIYRKSRDNFRGLHLQKTEPLGRVRRGFFDNVELRVAATYSSSGRSELDTVPDSRAATLHVHYSIKVYCRKIIIVRDWLIHA